MSERIVESIKYSIQQWNDVNKDELINAVLPSSTFLSDIQTSIQTVKSNLQTTTRSFRAENQKEIPRQKGLELLSQYDSHFTYLYNSSKTNDSAIAEAYTRLAVVDVPSSLLQLTSSAIKSLPDFSSQLIELQKAAEKERKKGETVASLLKVLNELKKECDEQISLARLTASSQSQIDCEFSLTEYQKKLKSSQMELKALESDYNDIKSVRDSKGDELRAKEADVDMKTTAKHEQIESLKNELKETKLTLRETERQSLEIEKNGSIAELTKQIEEIEKKIYEETDKEVNKLRKEIENKRKENEKNSFFFIEKISSLKKSIDSIEHALEELPPPAEWQRAKKEYDKITEFTKNENFLKEIEQKYDAKNKENDEKNNELETMKGELGKLDNEYEAEKSSITKIIEVNCGANSKNELISVLQSQIENLSFSLENNERLAMMINQQNQLKRSEKENFENEIIQLRKQVKNVDPENLKLVKYENFGKSTTSKKNGRNREVKRHNDGKMYQYLRELTNCCATNKKFRLSVFFYFVFIHVFIYVLIFCFLK